MQIHLLNCNSANPLSRRLQLNKLNTCIMVMEEFQKTYTVASIYREIFGKAVQHFYPTDIAPMDTSANIAAVPANALDTPAPVSAGDAGDNGQRNSPFDASYANINTEITSDLINSLVDETSVSDFWEAWGQLWIE